MSAFQTKNTYYLRLSPTTVLLLHLYLDDRHVGWMNERVWAAVLEDLRTRIGEKLKDESGRDAKLEVDTHRSEGYQFAYFFKRTDQRHAVMLKHRSIDYVEPPAPSPSPLSAPNPQPRASSKRKRTPAPTPTPAPAPVDLASPSPEPSTPARRSTRPRRRSVTYADADAGAAEDEAEPLFMPSPSPERSPSPEAPQVKPEPVEPSLSDAAFEAQIAPRLREEEEIDEKKLRPVISVSYSGFQIFGRTLCVIVEPYPPLFSTRSASLAPSTSSRQLSLAPASFPTLSRARSASVDPQPVLPSFGRRSQTPAHTSLFRTPTPFNAASEGGTPAPPERPRERPPVPLWNEPAEDEGEGEGGGEGEIEGFVLGGEDSSISLSQIVGREAFGTGGRGGGGEAEDGGDALDGGGDRAEEGM